MFVPSHSLPERSGAATLTLALTAGVLAALATLAPTMQPHRAPSSSMRLFDMSGADAPSTATPQPGSAPPPPPVPPIARARATQSASAAALRVPPPPEALAAPPLVVPVVAGPMGPASVPVATVAAGAERPAPAVPADTGEPARHDGIAADPYGRTVFREIRARQRYPEALARAGLEGTVVVELRISPRGRIVVASVLVSSQVRQLDEMALAQVRATALPPPPRGETRTFRIPMTYRIG